jgi:hypothetical protein
MVVIDPQLQQRRPIRHRRDNHAELDAQDRSEGKD